MSESEQSSIAINLDALKASVDDLVNGTKQATTTKTVKAKKKETPAEQTEQSQQSQQTQQAVVAPQVVSQVIPAVSSVIPAVVPAVVPAVIPAGMTISQSPVVSQPVSQPVAQVQAAQVKPDPMEFLPGTPDIVTQLLKTGVTEKQAIESLVAQVDEHPEIKVWANEESKTGRPKASLVTYFAVKRGVKASLNGNKVAESKSTKATLTKAAADASNLSLPTTNVQAQAVVNDFATVLKALKPSDKPLKRFVNERSNRAFLMWTDYLAAKNGQYSLRFRKFTVGDNSKPGKGMPSVYLLKGESETSEGQVVAKMSAKEFVVMISFLNTLSSNGSLSNIFQALVELEK